MVTRHECGQFPRTVRSLPQCLKRYLHLPENLLYYPKIRAGYVLVSYYSGLVWSVINFEIKESAILLPGL